MKTFELKVRCTVIKSVTVECETEQEARDNLWEFAIGELEIDQLDWEVEGIKEVE